MNCKPGDLAVIVGKQEDHCAHLEGKIVRVIALDPGGKHWFYEPPVLYSMTYGPCVALADFFLRPLRGDEGEDETLQLAGKPQGVAA